ncbi:primase-helicase zinc-binding domain-containing protein [Rhizobium sp. 32-5/1]|uniref:primase-helicase zinc-binding domain-containing protein n=1 Tax=Rhizobium sp. 32-5/1 TaxID=3019602 RepID=UPI00240DAE11|nr:primase-helicase zinc-binding domain-containing protein [Rhizobium sp. 32-5/1]WEZ84593.1 primase-helicase zinc-binding domain-containing protein [Rhizobium sp. 32-5/1]
MTAAIDEFINEARGVSVIDAAGIIGIKLKRRMNYAGPCPDCGGKDRFSINQTLGAWNCRQCGKGGRDGIGLVALAFKHDLHTRSGFLEACADVLGRAVPAEGGAETEEERADRLQRIADQKRRNEEAATDSAKDGDSFRQYEMNQARGLYLHAAEGRHATLADYLRRRTGFEMPPQVFSNIRYQTKLTYWNGEDERGHKLSHYVGFGMLAPFVTIEGRITGCHQTWIDLSNGPKFRVDLGLDDKGEPLPAKKMRGTKKGRFIPLFGLLSSSRWVGGEGIENGLAIAGAEGFRADTFYFAAGDLGNLAGPADPKSSFNHPTLKKADKNGRLSPVRVAGPVPKAGQTADDAMQVPDHVEDMVLLADGDSEPVFTAAAMARAENRLQRPGRTIRTWWPPAGLDFSKLLADYMGDSA